MTVTIELPADAGEWLEEKARREGDDPQVVAATLLVERLMWEAEDDREAVAGIQRGLDDFESGRFRPFGEVAEEQVRKHGLPESS